jgi:DNA-binding LytR/AlgR family response regulator
MPTCIIADDEPLLIQGLQAKLTKLWPELTISATARNGLEAVQMITEHEPDIAFLDIKMPGLTGIEVASRVQGGLHLVFITAFNDFAVDAFEREAVDYVLKPVTEDRLTKTIERLKQRLAKTEAPQALDALVKQLTASIAPAAQAPQFMRWVRALKGDLTHQIEVDDVWYFEAQDKYTVVHCALGELLIRSSLSELSRELNPNTFWQIHRSTILNMDYVKATQRDDAGHMTVLLKVDVKPLPVSRAYQQLFKQM